jgi:hypothetical protein
LLANEFKEASWWYSYCLNSEIICQWEGCVQIQRFWKLAPAVPYVCAEVNSKDTFSLAFN